MAQGYSRVVSDVMPSRQRQEAIQIQKCAWHVQGAIVTGTEENDNVQQEMGSGQPLWSLGELCFSLCPTERTRVGVRQRDGMSHTLKGLLQHLLGKECGVPKRKLWGGGSQTGKDGTWGEVTEEATVRGFR